MDAANILKPELARGDIQCIGATTLDEYRKHIEKDAALERRFQPITVNEPTQEDAVAILKGIRDKYDCLLYTSQQCCVSTKHFNCSFCNISKIRKSYSKNC